MKGASESFNSWTVGKSVVDLGVAVNQLFVEKCVLCRQKAASKWQSAVRPSVRVCVCSCVRVSVTACALTGVRTPLRSTSFAFFFLWVFEGPECDDVLHFRFRGFGEAVGGHRRRLCARFRLGPCSSWSWLDLGSKGVFEVTEQDGVALVQS